jgi:hypothetical protein
MTTATQSNWKVIGIEESDGERCECCGACCPKRRVVLTDGDREVFYGTSCASYRLLGSKEHRVTQMVLNQARAASFAREYLAKGFKPSLVANSIRVKFCSAWERDGGVEIQGVGLVTA